MCRSIGSCLFIFVIFHCSRGQTDLVARCETCHEVVKNFQKVCNLVSLGIMCHSIIKQLLEDSFFCCKIAILELRQSVQCTFLQVLTVFLICTLALSATSKLP